MIGLTYIELLIHKYKNKGIILDTNLLILFLIGVYDRSFISHFKRTNTYTEEDFAFLENLVGFFDRIVITPQILGELSNLTFEMTKPRFRYYFQHVVEVLASSYEKYVPKDEMLHISTLPNVGFTDLSIIEVAKNSSFLVLTDDLPLLKFLELAKCDFINLNHVRSEDWLS